MTKTEKTKKKKKENENFQKNYFIDSLLAIFLNKILIRKLIIYSRIFI